MRCRKRLPACSGLPSRFSIAATAYSEGSRGPVRGGIQTVKGPAKELDRYFLVIYRMCSSAPADFLHSPWSGMRRFEGKSRKSEGKSKMIFENLPFYQLACRSIGGGGRRRGNEMRVFVASLIVLSVLYFWNKDCNNGRLLDGLDSMRRSISHSMFH
jgi:hypothetical protein